MIALFSVVAAEAAVSTVSGCVIPAAAVRISAKTTVAVVVRGAASETAELKDGRKNHSMNIKTFTKPNCLEFQSYDFKTLSFSRTFLAFKPSVTIP